MSTDFDTRLLDLFYGELTPEEAAAVEAELSQDAAAQQTVADWHRVREAVKDLPVPEPDPQVHYTILRAAREAVEPAKPKGLWAWLSGVAFNPAFAGVAVMALAVGSVVFFQLNDNAPESALDKFADAPTGASNAPVAAGTKREQAAKAPAVNQDQPRNSSIIVPADGPAEAMDTANRAVAGDGDEARTVDDYRRLGEDGKGGKKDLAQRAFGGRGEGLDQAAAKTKGEIVSLQVTDKSKTASRVEEADKRPEMKAPVAKRSKSKRPEFKKGGDWRSKDAPLSVAKTGPSREKALPAAVKRDDQKSAREPTPRRDANVNGAPGRASGSTDALANRGAKKAKLKARRSRASAKPARRPASAPAKKTATPRPETAKAQTSQFAPPPPSDLGRGDIGSPDDAKVEREAAAAGKDGAKRVLDGVPVAAADMEEDLANVVTPTAPPAPAAGDLLDAMADDDSVQDRAAVAETRIVAKATVAPKIVVAPARTTMAFDSGGAPPPSRDGFSMGGGVAPEAAPAPMAANARQPEGRSESLKVGDVVSAAPAQPASERGASIPPLLSEARAARARGDHRAAVGAYAQYFQRHPRDGQFSRGVFEAAASYEALGQMEQAIRMYGLVPSTAGALYVRARARIGALRTLRRSPVEDAATDADDEPRRDVVDPMPEPPNVEPPR